MIGLGSGVCISQFANIFQLHSCTSVLPYVYVIVPVKFCEWTHLALPQAILELLHLGHSIWYVSFPHTREGTKITHQEDPGTGTPEK